MCIFVIANKENMIPSKFKVVKTHISKIKHGDTILINGAIKTVSSGFIKHDKFMGTTLYGDSFNLGYKLVDKLIEK